MMDRALGLAGILGGIALLSAFLLEIPTDPNTLRIVVFNLGAIAVIIAVHQRQEALSPVASRAVALAAVLANALVLAREVLPYGPWHPFAGDNGLTFFYAGVAMWATDAAFGLVSLRLGVVTRVGAVALASGSVLAITGIDRLGLTSATDPGLFGPLSQIGIVLSGVGWILLGFDVAVRRRARRQLGQTSTSKRS